MPRVLLSDNGTEFCSALLNTLRAKLDIRQVLCTPYHPESNGQLERAHGTLKDYLSFYASVEKPDDWDKHLGLAASAFNKSTHSALKFSPHEIVFGRLPHLPITSDETDAEEKEEEPSELAFQHQDRLRFVHDLAGENADDKKLLTKKSFDKRTKTTYFKARDKVLLKNSS